MYGTGREKKTSKRELRDEPKAQTQRERERERREAKVKSTWKEDRKKTFARRYLAIRTVAVAELLLQRHLYSVVFRALYDHSYSLFIIAKEKISRS